MKETELMIGDWVYDRRDDLALTEINPMRVTGIIKNGAFCQFGNDSYTITVSIDYIAPILLSAEVLEKNGWVKLSELSGAWELFINGVSVYVVPTAKYTYPVRIKGSAGQYEFEIRHVHELQHLLRLCGIKKEIEL